MARKALLSNFHEADKSSTDSFTEVSPLPDQKLVYDVLQQEGNQFDSKQP